MVGIDISEEQIRRARQNVPEATFIAADMCAAAFEADQFDAVGAFYAVTHLAPASQPLLLARIGRWLKPGGVLVASFGTGAPGGWLGQWMGATMYFGHSSAEDVSTSLAAAGLRVCRSSVEEQDDEDVSFRWIEAVRDC